MSFRRERGRDVGRDRQTDRQTETERQRETETNRDRETESERQTDSDRDRDYLGVMAVVVISPNTISIDKITGPSVCLYTFFFKHMF